MMIENNNFDKFKFDKWYEQNKTKLKFDKWYEQNKTEISEIFNIFLHDFDGVIPKDEIDYDECLFKFSKMLYSKK